ncbi:hypothetical protein Mtc_1503 [Methanocella conradii HZ254]|uniref:Uncharacterized protein n=1 Tax=Methanocella conradii (strain DSM 24694 / JCM 17849 / CGMCC 1.5162 / HZ254) TaxID=1041930 RepID=H8I621_METCZ|nr:hypothetical protein Mtc_1503 [Methanocella conradii HZ254]
MDEKSEKPKEGKKRKKKRKPGYNLSLRRSW